MLPCWMAYVVAGAAIMLILINAVLLGAAIVSWGERRLLGRFQNRVAAPIAGAPLARCSRLPTLPSCLPKRILFLTAPTASHLPSYPS